MYILLFTSQERYDQTFDEVVAINSVQSECTPENVLYQYNDNERELNMIWAETQEDCQVLCHHKIQPVGYGPDWVILMT